MAALLFSAGVCQTVLFVAALGDGLARRRWTRADVERPILVVCVSLLVILLALDLSGINRGEVIRLWIFLACLFQIPAAYVCARLNSRLAVALVVVGTLLQGALGTSMIGFVVP